MVFTAVTTAWPFLLDCNQNGISDDIDIATGFSEDCNGNNTPDECEVGGTEDCNDNGPRTDLCDLFYGTKPGLQRKRHPRRV